ncbi:MAG: hypothetical protein U0528_10485 [Anaerolineae bacterium]|nr:hypothetical protein [Anaerolineae bacterium]
MAGPGLDAIFDYISLLAAERTPEEPLLVMQVARAIQYKFPDFSFEKYALKDLREFMQMGERSGFFKLVEKDDLRTSQVMPGGRRSLSASLANARTQTAQISLSETGKLRWMNATLEALLRADRADQILEAIEDVDWRSKEFEDFLNVETRSLPSYTSRGKLRRLREFLNTLQEQGEAQAVTNWKSSRMVLRMPPVPPAPSEAPRTQSLLWSIIQGDTSLNETPPNLINAMFFAVLTFCRDQLRRDRAWDWVAALDIIEEEARTLRGLSSQPKRPTTSLLARTGRLGATTGSLELSDTAIQTLVAQLRREAGIRTTMLDPTPIYKGFVDTPSLDLSLQFLESRPHLYEDEGLLTWLDSEIQKYVANGQSDPLRNLANKSALVIAARQHGLQTLRQNPLKLRIVYDSVMKGIDLLKTLFGYIRQPSITAAADYLRDHRELLDEETIGPLLDEQLIRAAQSGLISAFGQLSERVVLWENSVKFGIDDGVKVFQREHEPRTAKNLQAEMGILLLVQTKDVNERYDILERFPSVGTQDGLNMIEGMLENLYFHNADPSEVSRQHEVKHLIERCLKVGIDRALAELK